MTTMPWFGDISRKRGHEMILCRDCDEPVDIEEEDWASCGECGRGLCAECSQRHCCHVCAEQRNNVKGACCCKNCVEICKECQNQEDGFSVLVHRGCKTAHLKDCLARKNPTERALVLAELTIKSERVALKKAKEELEDAQGHLISCQYRVQDIVRKLSAALEQKAKAEHELKKQAKTTQS